MILNSDPVPLSDNFTHPLPSVVNAYKICRKDEERILDNLNDTDGKKNLTTLRKELINIRILGHLLDKAPSATATAHITKTIVSCKSYIERVKAGEFYDQHFLRPFRSNKGRTPSPSHHPSRPSFDYRQAVIKTDMTENRLEYTHPQNHQQAKKSALLRDNFRCMVSGKVDAQSWEADIGSDVTITECAHIFEESTNTNLNDEAKQHYAASVWAVLEAFGYPNILKDLAGSNIHRLDNILTMDLRLHQYFDTLKLWFEGTEIPHCYNVVSTENVVFAMGAHHVVTFQSADEELALPNPTYLHIHAACCKVAHMSGAAGYYELLDGDDEYNSTGAVPADVLTARLHDISISQSHIVDPV